MNCGPVSRQETSRLRRFLATNGSQVQPTESPRRVSLDKVMPGMEKHGTPGVHNPRLPRLQARYREWFLFST
jgi:hypothetical protein